MVIEPLGEEEKKLHGNEHMLRMMLLTEVRSSFLLSYLRQLTFFCNVLARTMKATDIESLPFHAA